jgi:V8-like Glu-specific endopeptidase
VLAVAGCAQRPAIDEAAAPFVVADATDLMEHGDVAPLQATGDSAREVGFQFSEELYERNKLQSAGHRAWVRAEGKTSHGKELVKVAWVDGDDAPMDIPDAGMFFFELPESVCDPDERERHESTTTGPASGICQLFTHLPSGRVMRGTGWFFSEGLVVTAGHCIHGGEGGTFFPSVEVIPGMNAGAKPFGSHWVSSEEFRVARGWAERGARADDYAAIRVPVDSFRNANGERPFVFGADVLSDAQLVSAVITVSGYPADKPVGTQWADNGLLDSIAPKRLWYSIDTYGGHSGSGIYAMSAGRPVVVGIHNYGSCPNKCTRITSDVLGDLLRWRDEE